MKQKHQVGALLILLLIAGVVWLLNFRGKQVTADVVAATTAQQDPIPVPAFENPQIRLDEINRARKAEYKSLGRNPFSSVQAPPKPTPHHPDIKKEFPGPQQPPPTPPPPPLTLPANIKFYGFGTVPNGTVRLAFLTDGEEVYEVAEGEIFLKRFRVLRVGNASLEFEEVATGRTGTAPLVEEQTPGAPGAPPQ